MFTFKPISTLALGVLESFRVLSSKLWSSSEAFTTGSETDYPVIRDLTVSFCSSADLSSTCTLNPLVWYRLEKELYLHTAKQNAWLHVAQTKEKELTPNDLVIRNIKIGELDPNVGSSQSWESRPGGIWILRNNYTGDSHQTVTGVDVLFGTDAVDPRPQWNLLRAPLKLNADPDVPVARLSVRHGTATARPDGPRAALRVREDGKFKIVQISDTHMMTGVGVCKDAIDDHGQPLPESEADPLTVEFLGGILDAEKPDLVILTGDQLHHDIPDTQSALFKVVAPLIDRSVLYAAVFGNHDAEGTYALARTAQMSLLRDLPFSRCQSGPKEVDGVGNYYIQIFGPAQSQTPLSTLYLLDSHGQIPSEVKDPDYDWIKQSQIDWFATTSQALRKARENDECRNSSHLSLAFMHIPLPEYADESLIIKGGHRREPTEGPSFNSHFYDALAKEGIAAVSCGHDHVNDFCALLPQERRKESQQNGEQPSQLGPWLCYRGCSGFGGYCSYGEDRYHRRSRVWELDTNRGSIKTWRRVEYASERIDELVLVEGGAVVAPAFDVD